MQISLRTVLPISVLLCLAFFIPHAKADTLVDHTGNANFAIDVCQYKSLQFKYEPTLNFTSDAVEVTVFNDSGATSTLFMSVGNNYDLATPSPSFIFTSVAVPSIGGQSQQAHIPLNTQFITSNSYSLRFTTDVACAGSHFQMYFQLTPDNGSVSYTNSQSDFNAQHYTHTSGQAAFSTYKNGGSLFFIQPTDNSHTIRIQPGTEVHYTGSCPVDGTNNVGLFTRYCNTSVPEIPTCGDVYFQASCSNASFQSNAGVLPDGTYTTVATSTNNLDTIYYTIAPTAADTSPGTITPISCATLHWSCSYLTLFVGDVCKATSDSINNATCFVVHDLQNRVVEVAHIKPYGYVFQIYDAFHSDFNMTTSSTLPIVALRTGYATTTIVNPSTMFDAVPPATWAYWRPIGDSVIKISFLGYIVSLIL